MHVSHFPWLTCKNKLLQQFCLHGLPCGVLRLYLLQNVQACEVEGEHQQISQSPSCIQMWLFVPHKATVPQPAKAVDFAGPKRAARNNRYAC